MLVFDNISYDYLLQLYNEELIDFTNFSESFEDDFVEMMDEVYGVVFEDDIEYRIDIERFEDTFKIIIQYYIDTEHKRFNRKEYII